MPQTHWEPVALGSSGSEQREVAVYPVSSFQKAWLTGRNEEGSLGGTQR